MLEDTKTLHDIELEDNDTCCSSVQCCGSKNQPIIRSTPKIGRNSLCPCGSGRKFKKCCG